MSLRLPLPPPPPFNPHHHRQESYSGRNPPTPLISNPKKRLRIPTPSTTRSLESLRPSMRT
eukprot:3875808-Prorocentrum_lima.AAC.1